METGNVLEITFAGRLLGKAETYDQYLAILKKNNLHPQDVAVIDSSGKLCSDWGITAIFEGEY